MGLRQATPAAVCCGTACNAFCVADKSLLSHKTQGATISDYRMNIEWSKGGSGPRGPPAYGSGDRHGSGGYRRCVPTLFPPTCGQALGGVMHARRAALLAHTGAGACCDEARLRHLVLFSLCSPSVVVCLVVPPRQSPVRYRPRSRSADRYRRRSRSRSRDRDRCATRPPQRTHLQQQRHTDATECATQSQRASRSHAHGYCQSSCSVCPRRQLASALCVVAA